MVDKYNKMSEQHLFLFDRTITTYLGQRVQLIMDPFKTGCSLTDTCLTQLNGVRDGNQAKRNWRQRCEFGEKKIQQKQT